MPFSVIDICLYSLPVLWIFCIVYSMCFYVLYIVFSFASLHDFSKPFIWPHFICRWSHVHFEWLAMSTFSRTKLRGLSKRSWKLQAMLTTGFFLCMYRCELDTSCSQVIAIYFCYCAYWTWHHWLLARSGSHGKGDSYLTFMLRFISTIGILFWWWLSCCGSHKKVWQI